MKFGLKILEQKSILKPTQELEFLGFVINSKNMTISINKDKSGHTMLKIKSLLSGPSPSIRELASAIRSLISLFFCNIIWEIALPKFKTRESRILKKVSLEFWNKSMHMYFCNR